MKSTMMHTLVPAALAAAALAIPAQVANADTSLDLPAGQGCDFALRWDATGGNPIEKDFYDKSGNPVRVLSAGKGTLNTYTNLDTGKSISIKTDGSVTSTKTNPDGTLTVTATGHNGLIMFPSDVPAGPTTTQYTGKIVYNIDPKTGVFTLVSTTGTALDVCAALR